MTKVSYEKVLQFRRTQEEYSQRHPAQFRKFLYALNRAYTKTKKFEDDFQDKERLLNIEYCSKDDKGYAIMEKYTVERRGEKKEEERFKFTMEKQKELNIKKRELLNEEVDVECYVTDDIPDDLDFNWWSAFSPFVLPEEPTEEQLEKLYKRTEEKLAPKKA